MTSWPKSVPVLTAEQEAIREDFMKYWHEVLPDRYGRIERFNHGYPAARLDRAAAPVRTLEIGAGLGGHIAQEDLAHQAYTAMELRDAMADRIKERFPSVAVIVGDVQQHIPAADGAFDRVVAIHVLEHLPNLPPALDEVHRVLRPGGVFHVVVPCEGGLVYDLGRRLTSRRLFEKRYHSSYDWFIKSEHVNQLREILPEVDRRFQIREKMFWPFRLPLIQLNVSVGLTCVPRRFA